MPSGKVHAVITVLASAGLYLAAPVDAPVRTILAAGCLVGLAIGPDLDVDMQTASHSTVRRIGGPIPGLLWRLLWLPYAYLVPHRSWISHAPVISTLIRGGYIAALGWGLAAVAGWSWPAAPWWLPWAISGLMVSDVLHWAADRMIR